MLSSFPGGGYSGNSWVGMCRISAMRYKSHLMAIFIVIIPGLEIRTGKLLQIEPGFTGLQLTSVQK